MFGIKNVIIILLFLCFASTAMAKNDEVNVTLTVPDTSWAIAIEEVHQVGDEIWVISTVSQQSDVMGAQMISTVAASITISLPELPIKYFIIGKTWSWENTEPYIFLADQRQIENDLKNGKILYPQAERIVDAEAVLKTTWLWESTQTPVEKIEAAHPERYTIILQDEGKVQAQFDCNKGRGSYTISRGRLSFTQFISTRMACSENSQDQLFIRDLQRVTSFFVDNGNLYLELPYDSGTMKFKATH